MVKKGYELYEYMRGRYDCAYSVKREDYSCNASLNQDYDPGAQEYSILTNMIVRHMS